MQHNSTSCQVSPDICPMGAEISSNKRAVEDLEAWQSRQNGTLQRLEAKLDGLRNWIMGTLFTSFLAAIGWAIVITSRR
jgi:hypothetical protein